VTALAGLVVLPVLLAGCSGSESEQADAPPASYPDPVNVLLITMDTTRADYLGCYGNEAARTPVLDRLAREGVRFERCDACTPLTLPSHATIMTGTYPFVHGVRQNMFDQVDRASTTLAETLQIHGRETAAHVASVILRRRFGLKQGFRIYTEPEGLVSQTVAGAELRADEVCSAALQTLNEFATPPRRPFLLWVHFYDPHYPYRSDRHEDIGSPEAYADEIAFMDAQIGKLVVELERLRLADSTLLVAVGDHGEGLGDHGESEHGFFVFESTLQVPLIIWSPRSVPHGRVIDAQVGTVDLMPTILDYVGIEIPEIVQGQSLRPLIERGERATEPAYYAESVAAHEVLALAEQRVLYEGDWKYVHGAKPALYDLGRDPAEHTNRLDEEPERGEAMRAQLAAMIATPPVPHEEVEVALTPSAEEMEQLRALGYVGGGGSGSGGRGAVDESGLPVGERLDTRGAHAPDHAEAIERYVQAQRLIARRDYAAAEPLLREVVRALPGAPLPVRDLTLALRKQSREGEILDFCRDLLAEQPQASAMRTYYARLLIRDGYYEEALREAERAAGDDPDSAEAYAEAGRAAQALGREDLARQHLERSVELDPDEPRVLQLLARTLLEQDDLEGAARYLRRAVNLNPNNLRMKEELESVERRLEP
jgi:arylsulfatase A-like enzyme/Flp pilus assembly protein TadD